MEKENGKATTVLHLDRAIVRGVEHHEGKSRAGKDYSFDQMNIITEGGEFSIGCNGWDMSDLLTMVPITMDIPVIITTQNYRVSIKLHPSIPLSIQK